jgi:heat shock protein HslJ
MVKVVSINEVKGKWRVVRLRDGSGRLVHVIPGSRINMQITEEGEVAGKAGCNNYFCGIKVFEGKAKVSLIGATQMYCNEPGIMDQEMHFFSDLESSKVLEQEGDRLDLRSDDGALLISLERESDT